MKKFWSYFVFYLVQWTWGIAVNIFGVLMALGMLITGHKPYKCGPFIYFRTKWNFGGLEFGNFFVIGKDCDSVALHEMGHGVQNMIWGPLMVFWSASSAIRYWVREIRYSIGKPPKSGYDDYWLEGQATAWGKKFFAPIWKEHLEKRGK